MEDELIYLEILSKDCDNLLELVNKFIEEKMEFNSDDHFAFMGLCFLAKQIEHLRSMRILLNSEQFSDTMIIARIMVEGLAILGFALNNPDEKIPLKWRRFSVILDYRLLLEKIKNGETIVKKDIDEIFDDLLNFGNLFFKNKNKVFLESELLSHDPFSKSWSIKNNGNVIMKSDFLKNIGGELLSLYKELSGWVHWDTKEIGQKIELNNNRLKITANDPHDAKLSLGAGFLSLYGVVEMLNRHFNFRFDDKLNEIKSRFESDVNIIHELKVKRKN